MNESSARRRIFHRVCCAGVQIPHRVTDDIMRIVREFAASEIDRLADERTWVTPQDNEVVSARDLYEHIARLRGELEPVTYDFPPEATR